MTLTNPERYPALAIPDDSTSGYSAQIQQSRTGNKRGTPGRLSQPECSNNNYVHGPVQMANSAGRTRCRPVHNCQTQCQAKGSRAPYRAPPANAPAVL